MKTCITLFYGRVTSTQNSCAHNIEKYWWNIITPLVKESLKASCLVSRSQNFCHAVILFRLSESRWGQRNKSTVDLKWTVQELQHWTDWNRTTNPNPLEIKDKAPRNPKCAIFPPLIWEKGVGGYNFPSILSKIVVHKVFSEFQTTMGPLILSLFRFRGC